MKGVTWRRKSPWQTSFHSRRLYESRTGTCRRAASRGNHTTFREQRALLDDHVPITDPPWCTSGCCWSRFEHTITCRGQVWNWMYLLWKIQCNRTSWLTVGGHAVILTGQINNTYFPLRYGHYECAQELIYHGADVNSVNREKGAPIHYASRVDMVTLLLDHGADAYLARRIDDDKGWVTDWPLLSRARSRSSLKRSAKPESGFFWPPQAAWWKKRNALLQSTYRHFLNRRICPREQFV